MKNERKLLTIKQVAECLGIATQTIYNGLARGTLKPFPIRPKRWGRKVLFDSRDVDAFIDGLPYSPAERGVDRTPMHQAETPSENIVLRDGS